MIVQRTGDAVSLQFTQATVQVKPDHFVVNDYSIDMPGEFDVAGVSFEVGEGFSVLNADGMRLLVVFQTHPALSLEKISSVEDVELVVVYAEEDQKHRNDLASIINDLEPRGIVVVGSAEDTKALTGKTVESASKAKISSSDLEGEERSVWSIA